MRKNIVAERPAETATPPAMAIAVLLCKLVDVEDVDTIAYVAILVAFVPAVVTWTVTLLRNEPPEEPKPRRRGGGVQKTR